MMTKMMRRMRILKMKPHLVLNRQVALESVNKRMHIQKKNQCLKRKEKEERLLLIENHKKMRKNNDLENVSK